MKIISLDSLRVLELEGINTFNNSIQLTIEFNMNDTRSGFTLIENEIRSVLAQGVQNGGIADDTPYTVISPDPLTIPQMTRTARVADGFRFEARLAGAVSRVVIRGTVAA